MAAEKGNDYAKKYELEDLIYHFEKGLMYAQENDDCLCLQDAVFNRGLPYSSYFYFAGLHKELDSIKEETKAVILIRINKKTLEGTYVAAPGIFRMKQLGEKDTQHVKSENENKNTNINYDLSDLSEEELEQLNAITSKARNKGGDK